MIDTDHSNTEWTIARELMYTIIAEKTGMASNTIVEKSSISIFPPVMLCTCSSRKSSQVAIHDRQLFKLAL